MTFEEMRREYLQGELSKENMSRSPFEQFGQWFEQSMQFELPDWYEPHAVILATSDQQGRVTARTVLLRGHDEQGYSFFTNYDSEKGQQLAENPQAALLFYWAHLERQIRIEGHVAKLDRAVSEQYFHRRQRGSQISAAVSAQSKPIANRRELDMAYKEFVANLGDAEVPLPDNWGGYLLSPDRFEFWQGRKHRFHDRICYRLRGDKWELERLQP
jgi:pyridoxamine 5'-phosphate oxidase